MISQNRSNTHESPSADIGSIISTVADKLLNSKNLTTTEPENKSSSHEIIESFDQNYNTHPDYLLKHLALSEAVTNSVTRDETFVEKKNTLNLPLIEDTITLKPPISFQDTPLSYGHDSRPIVFYTPDLAADSTTHFRPIFDDPSLVESVDEDIAFCAPEESLNSINKSEFEEKLAPLLPVKNHINHIPVDQINKTANKALDASSHFEIPIVPPLRKDSKLRRRRLPPPPPPPPRPTPSKRGQVQNLEFSQLKEHENEKILHDKANTSDNNNNNSTNNENDYNRTKDEENCKKQIDVFSSNNDGAIDDSSLIIELEKTGKSENIDKESRKNKTVEINRLEIFHENKILPILPCKIIDTNYENDKCIENFITDDIVSESRNSIVNLLLSSSSSDNNEKKKGGESVDVWKEAGDSQDNQDSSMKKQQMKEIVNETFGTVENEINISESNARIIYQLDDNDDNEEVATRFDSEGEEDDDNGNDYYWQSNLETIGEDEEEEEEETSSLGYISM